MRAMNRLSPLAVVLPLLLAGCAASGMTDADTQPLAETVSSSSVSSAPKPIEAYPYDLSVEHFAGMTLSGSELAIGRVLERNAAYTRHYVTYRSNGVLVSGTFAIPNGEGPHPLVIQNHGYIDPAVYTNGRGLRREQDAMARAGFAVFHTDYRKHAQSDPDPDERNIYDAGLAYAMDSANAILAVRAANLPNVNAEKVGMLGHSMGGGVTLQILVAHPELIDAAVLYAPVSGKSWLNFDRWRRDDAEEAAETLAHFGTEEEQPERWAALSPWEYAENIDDPILLFHGLKDADVPIAWSNELAVHLETLDKDVRYITYPDDGHEFAKTWGHFMDTTIGFFGDRLGRGGL